MTQPVFPIAFKCNKQAKMLMVLPLITLAVVVYIYNPELGRLMQEDHHENERTAAK